MNQTLRRLLTFTGLLAAFTVVRFPYGDLIEDELREVQIKMATRGQHFSFSDVNFSFPDTVLISDFAVKLATEIGPVPISAEQTSGNLSLLSLLLGEISVDLATSLYGGEITGPISKSIFSDIIASELTINELKIENHPLAQLFGAGGSISGQIEFEGNPQQRKVESLDAKISLQGGSLRAGHVVASIVKLPAITDFNAEAKISTKDSWLLVDKLVAKSSIGSVELQGSFLAPWAGDPRKVFNTTMSIELSPAGQEAFGGYLALAAGRDPSYRGKKWGIAVSKQTNKVLPDAKVHLIE